jgi:mercuric ion transport protein
MKDRTLLRVGGIGAAIVALCCVTPVLVLLLGVLGLSAWVAGLDYVLFPLLALFLALAIIAALRLRRRHAPDA